MQRSEIPQYNKVRRDFFSFLFYEKSTTDRFDKQNEIFH